MSGCAAAAYVCGWRVRVPHAHVRVRRCGKKSEATKALHFVKLPPTMTLHLKRCVRGGRRPSAAAFGCIRPHTDVHKTAYGYA